MNQKTAMNGLVVVWLMLFSASCVGAQDWPQWRGPHRDARATGFKAPQVWPQKLTEKWKVPVGEGVATPALVGNKLYVFTRQEGKEVTRCVNAATGKTIWEDSYAAQGPTGPSSRFPGPRSSPAVADGKIVTLGVRGTLSCLDAATGKKVWRKEDFQGLLPRFFTSCSPLIANGLCIVQLGGERKGGIVAYDLATGDEKWKWTGDGTAYASPVRFTVDGTPVIVAETANHIVGIGLTDGKLLWQTPFPLAGRRAYNAATPIVDGQTIIYSGTGRGTKAVQLEKKDGKLIGKELWSNPENSVQFNTPVLKNGLLYGLSARDSLFCINAQTGKTAWTAARPGGRGYGSILDAGSVLLALTPGSELIVFEPSAKGFKELAKYKVADSPTYAYPVVAGNRVFIKDRDNLRLWTIE
jgi:outer membrane protein assembly factor BamB